MKQLMTRPSAPAATVRAGIYARISQDAEECAHCQQPRSDPRHQAGSEVLDVHPFEEGRLGVKRQEKECRELATRLGWEVADVYKDNDQSAYSGKPRKSYRRLLDDVRVGAVQAVVAWHPDRLYRHPKDLEEFITVVEQAGCAVQTVQAGNMDLSQPSGRAVARTLGAWGRYESEHKAERVKSKHRQLAEAGEDAGNGRPFGYEPDRRTVRPVEAALVREAANRVLAGEALRSVCRDWSTRGIKSATGRPWSIKVFRGMLLSARISGRRERGTLANGHRPPVGEIVATAVWPGIISPEQSDRLRAVLTDPTRRLNGHPTKYLLTGGIAVCGLCGAPMVARPKQNWRGKGEPSIPSLVCAAGPGFKGCGGIRIAAGPLDALVSEAVLQAVDSGALAKALRGTGEDRKAVAELAHVEQKLADLAEDEASDRITRVEWEAKRKTLAARQTTLRRRVETAQRKVGLDGLPDPLRAAWPTLALHQRRAVVSALMEAVVVGRGVRGLSRFDERRVSLRWAKA
jgi:DNA invertase Pin-like site-specific DNA recombinase